MKAQIDSMISAFTELDSQQRGSIIHGSPAVSIEARLYLYSRAFHLSNCSPSIAALLVDIIPTISVAPLVKLAQEYLAAAPQPLSLSHLSSCIISYLKWNTMLFSPIYSVVSHRGAHPISSMLSSLGDCLCLHARPITEALLSEILAEPPYEFLELLQAMAFTNPAFSNGRFLNQPAGAANQLKRPVPGLLEKIQKSIETDKRTIKSLFEKHLALPEGLPFPAKLERISVFQQRWRGVFSGEVFKPKTGEISLEISSKFAEALDKLQDGDCLSLLELRGEPLAAFAEWLRGRPEGGARARVEALAVSAAKSVIAARSSAGLDSTNQSGSRPTPSGPQELRPLEKLVTQLLGIVEVRNSLFFGEKNEDFAALVSLELGMIPAFGSQLCRLVDHLLRSGDSRMNYLAPLELVRFLPSKSEFLTEYEYSFMVRNLCGFEEIKLEEERQLGNLLGTICTEGETDRLMGLIHDLERLSGRAPRPLSTEIYTFRPLYSPHWQPLMDQLPLRGLEPLSPPPDSPLSPLIDHSLSLSTSFLSPHRTGELSLGLTTLEVTFPSGLSLRAPLFVMQLIEAISTNEGSHPSQLAALFAEKGRPLVPRIIEALLERNLVIASEKGVFLHPKISSGVQNPADIPPTELPLTCFIDPGSSDREPKAYTDDTRVIKAKIVWILKQKKQISQKDIEEIVGREYRQEGPLAIKRILADLIDDQVICRDKNDPDMLILA